MNYYIANIRGWLIEGQKFQTFIRFQKFYHLVASPKIIYQVDLVIVETVQNQNYHLALHHHLYHLNHEISFAKHQENQ